ncbi:MAG: glycoside hydrolase family 127 protein [Mucilaginibacter polytrichastri]|nr:glycoside hydrolase family 127 protein [Mucilaginibacter polytrichastri]
MKNSALLFWAIVFPLCLCAQQKVKPKVTDALFTTENQVLTGFIGEKLAAAYTNRIMAQDAGRLAGAFESRTEDRCWQSEFWGKWFTSAVLAYRYHPDPQLKKKLAAAVDGLLNTQTPDGYIGNYAPEKRLEQWDIWGSKYCMLGLIAWYDLAGDKKALNAAGRLADNVRAELSGQKTLIVQKGNHRGMAAGSVLEPLTQLYVRTGEKKYLDFAEEIIRAWESDKGPQLIAKAGVDVGKRFPVPENWFGPEQGQKAYEMMSCYEGLLEMYRITGNPEYRSVVERVWQNIFDTEINIVGSGSAMECWYGGRAKQALATRHAEETCVTATWIKLSAQLLRLTGETKYAQAIERTYYNALLGSMTPDGRSWAKYTPIMGIRSLGEDQCAMGLNCCVASGPRALFLFPRLVLMRDKDGAHIQFYNAGNYAFFTPGNQAAKLVQESAFPSDGLVKMRVELKKPELMTLRFRIPEWSAGSSLTVNGEKMTAKPGEYVAVKREWSAKDRIELNLDMRGRIEKLDGQPQNLALLRGPLVLARDLRFTGNADVDETITPVTDKDGFARLQKMDGEKGFWSVWSVPCLAGSYRAEESAKPVNLTFSDYASSGNTFSNASRYRIWFPQLVEPGEH